MAEEKPPFKLKHPIVLVFWALIIAAIVNGILAALFNFWNGLTANELLNKIVAYLVAFGHFISTFASIFFATGVVYSTIQLTALRTAERKRIRGLEQAIAPKPVDGKPRNLKWERVAAHISSDNPNDWRLAILEADVILDEMLTVIGYHGETIGDKLKAVEKSDFTTVDLAWEAHKVRNQIAHEGSDFLITQREAKRIIQLYRRVFEEFRFI